VLFFQLLTNGLVAGCLYALIALGFGLIYNTTRIFHLAHGAVYVLAAYLFYGSFALWQLPLGVAIVFAIAAAIVFGILIEKAVYGPLERKGVSLRIHLLSSLGIYIVVVNVIALSWGNETKVPVPGVQRTFAVGGVILTEAQVATVIVFLLIFGCMAIALRWSSWGRWLRAMRDDPELVSAMGVNPARMRRIVFGVGSGLAGAAAVLLGLDVGINPHIGLMAVLYGAVAVIIGGIGVFEGAALGALLLGVLRSLAIWQGSSRWQEAAIFLVLVLFLLFRPEGLLGHRRRVEEIPT
jgi:branched-chain amino acid transport system permease protein